MDRQARNSDTELVKSREMTDTVGAKHCRGGKGTGVKTTENKIHWSRWGTSWNLVPNIYKDTKL
jgi:hypothetical protein